jgi:hypothetical protein
MQKWGGQDKFLSALPRPPAGHYAVEKLASGKFAKNATSSSTIWLKMVLPWNAGKDDGSGHCSKNRTQPYVKMLRITTMTAPGCVYHVHYIQSGRPPVTVP